MSSGAAIWSEIVNEEVKRRTKSSSSGTGKPQPTSTTKAVVNKKKYKTAAEYMAALNKTGV